MKCLPPPISRSITSAGCVPEAKTEGLFSDQVSGQSPGSVPTNCFPGGSVASRGISAESAQPIGLSRNHTVTEVAPQGPQPCPPPPCQPELAPRPVAPGQQPEVFPRPVTGPQDTAVSFPFLPGSGGAGIRFPDLPLDQGAGIRFPDLPLNRDAGGPASLLGRRPNQPTAASAVLQQLPLRPPAMASKRISPMPFIDAEQSKRLLGERLKFRLPSGPSRQAVPAVMQPSLSRLRPPTMVSKRISPMPFIDAEQSKRLLQRRSFSGIPQAPTSSVVRGQAPCPPLPGCAPQPCPPPPGPPIVVPAPSRQCPPVPPPQQCAVPRSANIMVPPPSPCRQPPPPQACGSADGLFNGFGLFEYS